jgi:hypothetical protein
MLLFFGAEILKHYLTLYRYKIGFGTGVYRSVMGTNGHGRIVLEESYISNVCVSFLYQRLRVRK